MHFWAKHLHQKGGKSLEEVPRETLSLEMFVLSRQNHGRLVRVGDNAASGKRLTRDQQKSLPTNHLGVCH